jgi:hypothetical protein
MTNSDGGPGATVTELHVYLPCWLPGCLAAWRRVVHVPCSVVCCAHVDVVRFDYTCINIESVCMWHVRWHVLRSQLTPGIARGTA